MCRCCGKCFSRVSTWVWLTSLSIQTCQHTKCCIFFYNNMTHLYSIKKDMYILTTWVFDMFICYFSISLHRASRLCQSEQIKLCLIERSDNYFHEKLHKWRKRAIWITYSGPASFYFLVLMWLWEETWQKKLQIKKNIPFSL